jgi:hypothetical protein
VLRRAGSFTMAARYRGFAHVCETLWREDTRPLPRPLGANLGAAPRQ